MGDAGRLLLATLAWVAPSSPGSRKTMRPHRPRFPSSPNTSVKRTEEVSASVDSSIKTQRTPRPKGCAWKSPFLCPSTKEKKNLCAKQKQHQQQNITIKKRKLKLPPLC